MVKITPRSRAREVALQMLFQYDANTTVTRPVLSRFVRQRIGRPADDAFCLRLYDGVLGERAAIDERLTKTAENWRLQRMASVDRNVLRLGAYELLFANDETPGPVVINEAIELARRFGSEDSPGFVNGILDKIYQTHKGSEKVEG